MALSELTLAMLTLAGYFQPDQCVAGQEHKYSSVMADLLRPISYRIADWGQYHVPDMELYRKLDDSSLGRQYKIYVTVKYGLHSMDWSQARSSILTHILSIIRMQQ